MYFTIKGKRKVCIYFHVYTVYSGEPIISLAIYFIQYWAFFQLLELFLFYLCAVKMNLKMHYIYFITLTISNYSGSIKWHKIEILK